MSKRNDAELTEKFNRRLGRRSSVQSAKARTNYITPDNVRAGQKYTRTRISLGTQNLKAPVKKAYDKQFQTGVKPASVSNFKATINNVFADAEKEVIKRANTERAIKVAQQTSTQGEPSLWDRIKQGVGYAYSHNSPQAPLFTGKTQNEQFASDVVDASKGNSAFTGDTEGYWKGLMEGFSRSPAGRSLDLISRPVYAVNNFAKEGFEADPNEDFWQTLGSAFKGGASGLAGTEKPGFGDVINAYTENSQSAPAEAFRGLEEGHPELAQNIKRAGGLVGDIVVDPLKGVHGAPATILARTGEEATEQTVKASARSIAETAARDAMDDILSSRPGSKFRPDPASVAQRAINNAESAVDASLLEVSSGARGGFSKLGNEQFAQSISNEVATSVQKSVLEPFEKKLTDLVQPVGAGRTPNIFQMRSHLARNPEFRDLLDNVENELAGKGRNYATTEDMLNDLRPTDMPLIEKAANVVRQSYDIMANDVYQQVYAGTRDMTYNTIGIKLPTGKTIPVKTVGKVWKALKEKAPADVKTLTGEASKAISFEHNFPGRISLLTQKERSLGMANYESFRDSLAKVAKDYSHAESREIQFALDEGRTLTGKLETGRAEIEKMYKQIFTEEIANGVRPENAQLADDYTFIYNKGGSKEARAKFKEARKKGIASTGSARSGNGMQRAIKDGLKPVDNAFEALLLRKMKSSRDLTRAYFMKDLADYYGIMSKDISPGGLRARKLAEVKPSKLNAAWRKTLEKQGEKLYLPEEHMNMYKAYEQLSGFDPKQGGRVLREYSKITSMLKWAQTVPRPGFHIRNMIGDYFMGLLDNVPSRTYGEVASKWEAWKTLNKMPSFRITDKISHSVEDMWAKYQQYANTGFFETELEHAGVGGSPVKRAGGKVAEKLRDASEARENFGRFTHFVAAYRQEAQKLVEKGIKDTSKIEKTALEAAVWRVNHYKFDYNALTSMERGVKLAFPFYTFTRKATPTLLESLFLSPHYMGVANRFMQLHDGSSADAFNSYYLPDYVKDTGYAFAGGDQDEPLYMRGDILPTNTLNNLDFTNTGEFFKSLTAQSNPLLQAPFELAAQRQLFNDQPTGSIWDYLGNKAPVGQNLGREIQNKGNEPWWLARVNNTFTGAGIPLNQFTKGQQDQGFREAEDRFIQDPFYDFNRNDSGIKVYQSNQANGVTSFRVSNDATGEVLYESTNPTEALQYAKKLAGGK